MTHDELHAAQPEPDSIRDRLRDTAACLLVRWGMTLATPATTVWLVQTISVQWALDHVETGLARLEREANRSEP